MVILLIAVLPRFYFYFFDHYVRFSYKNQIIIHTRMIAFIKTMFLFDLFIPVIVIDFDLPCIRFYFFKYFLFQMSAFVILET